MKRWYARWVNSPLPTISQAHSVATPTLAAEHLRRPHHAGPSQRSRGVGWPVAGGSAISGSRRSSSSVRSDARESGLPPCDISELQMRNGWRMCVPRLHCQRRNRHEAIRPEPPAPPVGLDPLRYRTGSGRNGAQTMIDVARQAGQPGDQPRSQGRLMESLSPRRGGADLCPGCGQGSGEGSRRPAEPGRRRGAGRRPGAESSSRHGGKPAPMLGLTLVLRWAPALDDIQIEDGLAGWGSRLGPEAEDWLAGAEYAARLLRGHQQLAAEHSENEASARQRSSRTTTRRPTRRRAAQPAAPPTLRRDTGSVRCECSLTIRLAGDGCRHCQPQTYIDSLEMCAEDNLRTIEHSRASAPSKPVCWTLAASELALMARMMPWRPPASPMQVNSVERGWRPDVGSIHQNIRALKDRLAQVDRKTAGQPKSCRSTEQLQVIQEALRLLPSDEARRVAREPKPGRVP